MKRCLWRTALVLALLFCGMQSVFAEVRTTNPETAFGVTVAGNTDFYPIEYYDEKNGEFDGVMPDILRSVSARTGLHFCYLRSLGETQTEVANRGQAEVVSAYVTDSVEAFAVDTVKVFSYTDEGKTVHVGLAFTEAADAELVASIKAAVAAITKDEITGFFVENGMAQAPGFDWRMNIAMICCFLLLVFAILMFSQLEKTKKQMDENRTIDDETGIGNLTYFEQQFDHLLDGQIRTNYYIAYIIIDNNVLQLYHGETVFEDAVAFAAEELTVRLEQGAFAARITESGFAIAFEQSDADAAEAYIEKILRRLNGVAHADDSLAKPIFHAAFYHLQEDDGNCGLLLFNLRRNCNKIVGTDTVVMFCDVHAMNSALEEKKLSESFTRGIQNKEFKIYLQFVVDNKTKKIVSAEALSRWDSPEKGLLLPGCYIEALESLGKISELDFYMFEQSCRLLHKWNDTDLGKLSISCNFTRITLSEDGFADRIRELAARYIFDHAKLIIEITEDAIEKNRDNALENVFACKQMGFRIALDDLGSGYTSLVNLCDYPVDIVKLDRDILLKSEKENGKELVCGIVALAHSLNKKVVCEGVETEAQERFVSDSDCDFVQGWYYSKPLAEKESEAFYRLYNKTFFGGEA